MADHEHSKSHHDHKKKKRKKLIAYITILVILKVIAVAIFILVVVRAQSPKLRLSNIRLQTLVLGTPASPTFDLTFTSKVTIKNPNLGHYKYKETTVSFVYEGIIVGQVVVPGDEVGMRSTKKVEVLVNASSARLAGQAGNRVASELGAGALSLIGKGVMRGKVEFFRFVKKSRNAEMDCYVVFDLSTRLVQRLECE